MKEIVVISGKGGTGKTTVTAALAGLGPNKVIADCDVDAADMHLIMSPEVKITHDFYSGELAEIDPEICIQCGECREMCRFGAINEDFQVLSEHCEGCALCSHVCPVQAVCMNERLCGQWYESTTRFGPLVHASLGIGEENSGKLVTTVRKASQDTAEEKGYELVLVDGSPGIGCPVIASLTNADVALLVGEPTVSAIGDLHRVSELTAHFGIKTLALINKADINPGLVQELKDFCLDKKIEIVGELPYASSFTQAQLQGQTICEYDSQGLGQNMAGIWARIESCL
ncbi:MAG: ATP-binding protein [Desulfovermiculus sp.]